MLENLINIVRQQFDSGPSTQSNLINNKESAIQNAGGSIMDTLKNAASSGRIRELLDFFKSGNTSATSNQLVKEATGNYAHTLQQTQGLDMQQAEQVANQVVPNTMNQLANRAANPADQTFNLQDIFNHLTNGKTSGFNMQNLINKYASGTFDKDGDGDVDLQDIKALFTGGGASNGGLVDKLKNLF